MAPLVSDGRTRSCSHVRNNIGRSTLLVGQTITPWAQGRRGYATRARRRAWPLDAPQSAEKPTHILSFPRLTSPSALGLAASLHLAAAANKIHAKTHMAPVLEAVGGQSWMGGRRAQEWRRSAVRPTLCPRTAADVAVPQQQHRVRWYGIEELPSAGPGTHGIRTTPFRTTHWLCCCCGLIDLYRDGHQLPASGSENPGASPRDRHAS
ncbi:hypothetical protein F5X68DRAFT_45535 [Plectosphaerella plurivora]|uniref:Uncharacterized protein n=1 Tax=Plectosphaerella plurivora TaxID=936078 RepID=A0A9P9ABL2_9PEZI|nr:hypothetical protein F5X68DRAFT_45535 [Plectosphaerella plurivora]